MPGISKKSLHLSRQFAAIRKTMVGLTPIELQDVSDTGSGPQPPKPKLSVVEVLGTPVISGHRVFPRPKFPSPWSGGVVIPEPPKPPDRAPPSRREPRNHPVRFVVETKEVTSSIKLSRLLSRMTGLATDSKMKARLLVKPLFPGAPADEPYRLAHFQLVTLPFRHADMKGKAFDMAYGVAQTQLFRNVWVDLNGGGVQGGPTSSAPTDLTWSRKAVRLDLAERLPPARGGRSAGQGIVIGHPDTGWNVHPDLDRMALDLDNQLNLQFLENPRDARDPRFLVDPTHAHGLATASVLVSGRSTIVPPERGEEVGVRGVAPGAKIIPIRCCDTPVNVFTSDLAASVWWAIEHGAHVISMSLGGIGLPFLEAVIAYAVRERNVIVCAAAGNYTGMYVVSPANYPDSIAVAATGPDDKPWSESSRGQAVDISAPGHQVWVADLDKNERPVVEASSGTSFATPHVAGTAALWLAHHNREALLSRYGGRLPLQYVFKELIQRTARRPQDWPTEGFGPGILDAHALLTTPLPAVEQLKTLDEWRRQEIVDQVQSMMDVWDPVRVKARLDELMREHGDKPLELVGLCAYELLQMMLTTGENVVRFKRLLLEEAADAVKDAAKAIVKAVERAGKWVSDSLRELFG